MRNLVFGMLLAGLTSLSYAQSPGAEPGEVALEEVTVSLTNMDYLNDVQDYYLAKWVRDMQRKAANFDVKNSGLFDEELERYEVRFSISKGNIRAIYDEDGKIITTMERYKDVPPPASLRQAIYSENPGWTIEKNAYLVTYDRNKDVKRTYKTHLRKGEEKKRIKHQLDRGHTM